VLVSFLVTGMVAAQLFHRTQRALETAENRAREVERLSALGAESLSVPRASDAVAAIARVIGGELPVRSAEVLMLDPETGESVVVARAPDSSPDTAADGHVPPAAREGRIVLTTAAGREEVAPAGADLATLLTGGAGYLAVLVPLHARGRNLGFLRLGDPEGLHLDRAQAVFADTLGYYAALAVERVRLSAEAEHVEALREADRLKDALLASVSHDLRTPLTTIRALASELRASGDEKSAVIEQEAERLNRLVTDLLDLSRIRGGALPLEPQVIAAEDLVGAMLQRMGGVAGADRIDVRLPPGAALPVGRFDFVHALRALGNLVENALRHSPSDGRVLLEVSEEGDDLIFAVHDRGPGIDDDDRARIFEPFYQTPSGERHRGTGLGLAIARSVAEAQGGSVCHRPRPGGGSTFELRLPRESLEGLA
jgi:two-component system sensor histidine kinase KdpD